MSLNLSVVVKLENIVKPPTTFDCHGEVYLLFMRTNAIMTCAGRKQKVVAADVISVPANDSAMEASPPRREVLGPVVDACFNESLEESIEGCVLVLSGGSSFSAST